VVIVTSGNKPNYRTAFFEAFPRVPDTFIRGEGATIEEAEEKAWCQYQKYFDCDHPSFEPRDYQNGAGYCTKCGLWFPNVIPPFHPCTSCGIPTWYSQDKDGGWWCEKHNADIPEDKLQDYQKRMREWEKENQLAPLPSRLLDVLKTMTVEGQTGPLPH
jgi:hypothetical protein